MRGIKRRRCGFVPTGPVTRTIGLVALAECIWAAERNAAAGDLPFALEAAYQSRACLETAVIEYEESSARIHDGATISYRVRLAGPDLAVDNLGDPSGVVGGNPARAGRPHSTLITPDATYSHDHDGIDMRLSDGDQRHEGAVQPRSLGVTPFVPVRDIGATLERGVESARPRDRRFSETRVGDEYEVLEERGGGIVRWRLDPARGWSPTRVTFERDGHVMQEARSSLRQQDGIWYPEKVEYFNSQYADGAKPESVIRSTKVEFLRPEHPKRLLPSDIGIEPGFFVERIGAKPGSEAEMWDGAGAVTLTQWAWLERRGVVERGPTNRAALNKATLEGGAEGKPTDRIPSSYLQPSADNRVPLMGRAPGLWERYTREFIEDYKLDVEQTQRAWRILKDCQKEAKDHLRAKADELDEADRALNALPVDDRRGERGAPARQRLWTLLEPIDRIFFDRLKPGLDRLPTRAQRAATHPATQASSKP
ncbi:MAG: hypothetical protein U1D55_13130 [Phycisphaerae bacterium]